MAIVRRSGFRNARRTNWTGVTGSVTIDDADLLVVELVNVGSASQEVSNYVNPTLTRIRGQIIPDPDFGDATGIFHCYVALMASQVAPTGNYFQATTGTNGNISSDHILWTGAMGFSRNVSIIAGADSEHLSQYAMVHGALDVDVKAQRKMGDDMKLYLLAQVNTGGPSVPGFLTFALRFLWKE